MTWSINGKQYVCWNFGDASHCCVKTGLSWYYTVGGTNYNETGATAQAVSRLASGLITSLTMTNPPTGTFTQAQLNTANGSSVTLQDAQEITLHDEPAESQWCYIPCSAHATTAECTQYGCYWWNNACHDTAPSCTQISTQAECTAWSCFWYNGSCHGTAPTGEQINNQSECTQYGFYWYNGSCHSSPPSCEVLDNQSDCGAYSCYWYRNACHGADQPQLCYWIDVQGGPTSLIITKVFIIIDSYLFNMPPTGYAFIPTLQQVFGVIDYYLGFDGDQSTGCNYY